MTSDICTESSLKRKYAYTIRRSQEKTQLHHHLLFRAPEPCFRRTPPSRPTAPSPRPTPLLPSGRVVTRKHLDRAPWRCCSPDPLEKHEAFVRVSTQNARSRAVLAPRSYIVFCFESCSCTDRWRVLRVCVVEGKCGGIKRRNIDHTCRVSKGIGE